MEPGTGSPRLEPRRHSRLRLAFFRAAELASSACGGRAWYRRRHLARGRFAVRREVVGVDHLSRGLEGFTIAQLSDLHAGSFLGEGDLAGVVDELVERDPDVVVVTGDWITHRWSEVRALRRDFERLRPRRGIYAVFGNHDYKDRLEHRIVEELGPAGVRFLRNECVRIDTGEGAVALVGIEDLEEAREIDLEAARSGVRAGDVEVVLCHNPSGARSIARPGCAAILSGHTHGTQIDLPWLRRLGPRHPGLRIELGGTRLIVSRGLGVVGVPLRVGSPPEIVLIRLERRPAVALDESAERSAPCTAASR
jgi:predicted MPP superfamily phosphohydrolase